MYKELEMGEINYYIDLYIVPTNYKFISWDITQYRDYETDIDISFQNCNWQTYS